MGVRGSPRPTPTYGMPNGGGPKSGWSVRVRPTKSMNAADCGSIGALVISWFHQLSDGKGRRPSKSSLRRTAVEVGAGAGAGAGVVGAGADGTGVGATGVLFVHAAPATIITMMTADCRLPAFARNPT